MAHAPEPAAGAGAVAVVGRLTPSRLTAPVRRLLSDPAAAVTSCGARAIYSAVNTVTAGVYRVAGSARLAGGGPAPWSLVLKVVRSPAGLADDELGAEREVLAYRSGLLTALEGVRAPRCYGIDEPGDG